jgi:hypothetical protein
VTAMGGDRITAMSASVSPAIGKAGRAILIGLALLVASPSFGQTPDPFQSVPAPVAKPAPRPRAAEPPEPEPEPPAPPPAASPPAVAAPAPAAAAPIPPGAVPVASGAVSVIRQLNAWNPFCRALPVSVTVVAQPQHGVLAIRDEGVPIPAQAQLGSSGRCAGTVIAGKRVYYQSQAGYRGADRVVYVVVMGVGQPGRTVTIDIAIR